MLTGLPPWYTRNRQELFARIREADLECPDYLSPEAISLITSLLHREPDKRLGSQSASQVKAHPFFDSVEDWNGLIWTEPPFRPSDGTAKEMGDTSNFEKEFTDLPVDGSTPGSVKTLEGSEIRNYDIFTGFTYEAPNISVGSHTSEPKSNSNAAGFL